jgi:hypothetical protein
VAHRLQQLSKRQDDALGSAYWLLAGASAFFAGMLL